MMAPTPYEYAPQIVATLNALEMVEWDRCGGPPRDGWLQVFGWITRPDTQLDYVSVWFLNGEPDHFSTSSAQHSKTIETALWSSDSAHGECVAVRELLPGVTRIVRWQ